jgi:predicted ATPase
VSNHANTICYAGLHAVTLAFWRGDVEGGRAVNEEMRRIAFEHDMALWKIYCSLHEAELACMEDGEDAAGKLDAALDDYKESGCGLWITLYLAEQAKFHLRRDDLDSARKSIARARDEMDESGEEWAKSELCRIEGEIHLREGNRERAKKVFEGAIEIARYQDAQALELAAMHALERLANNVG